MLGVDILMRHLEAKDIDSRLKTCETKLGLRPRKSAGVEERYVRSSKKVLRLNSPRQKTS